MMEQLLDGEAEAIVRKAVEKAKEGGLHCTSISHSIVSQGSLWAEGPRVSSDPRLSRLPSAVRRRQR